METLYNVCVCAKLWFCLSTYPEKATGGRGPRSYVRSGHSEAIWSSLALLLEKLPNRPDDDENL